MRRFVVAAVFAALAVTPAHATTSYPGPGVLCGFASVTDPTTGRPDIQTGAMFASPLVVLDDSRKPSGGTLICSIQVNAGTHAGPDAVTVSSSDQFLLVLFPPTLITYAAGPDDTVFYCSAFQPNDGSPMVYWSDAGAGGSGTWTTNANAPCGVATSVDSQFVQDVIDDVLGVVNDVVCPPIGCHVDEQLPVRVYAFVGLPPVTT